MYINAQAYVKSADYDAVLEQMIATTERADILEAQVRRLVRMLQLRSNQLKLTQGLNEEPKPNENKLTSKKCGQLLKFNKGAAARANRSNTPTMAKGDRIHSIDQISPYLSDSL